MPGHTHFLDTFWKSTVSKVQFGRKCQVTLTSWTHFETALSAKSSFAGNARSHSHTGHILREHCQQSPVLQEMLGHTHSLDTFWESTVSTVQFGRKCQATLTYWTHFERAPSAKSSFAGNARSHSQPGHILREHCKQSPVLQEMPGHTHSLDTFWESTVSKVQFGRSHLQPGHILREHCQQSPVWQEMPGHTHSLGTFSESTVSKVQFGRKCQVTLTSWTHFERECCQQSPVLQEMPGHTHSLDTFWESTVSKVQFCRKCQVTLTSWTHFERALSAKSSFAGNARSHSLSGHILREHCKQSPVWQKMPGHTHSLDTFWESAVSKVQFCRKCQVTLTPWTHFERALLAKSRKCQVTLTFWTHFERALLAKSSFAENARSHSLPGHILREHC